MSAKIVNMSKVWTLIFLTLSQGVWQSAWGFGIFHNLSDFSVNSGRYELIGPMSTYCVSQKNFDILVDAAKSEITVAGYTLHPYVIKVGKEFHTADLATIRGVQGALHSRNLISWNAIITETKFVPDRRPILLTLWSYENTVFTFLDSDTMALGEEGSCTYRKIKN
jgi:hypothetical protein